MLATCILYIWVCSILITLSGDIEKNPWSKSASWDKFSICHWNIKSISARNFIKIFLLSGYISTQNFDILSLSETYLDSSISSNDNNLTIPDYDLCKADHPSNAFKCGGFVSTIVSVESNRNSIRTRMQYHFRNENRGKGM